MKGKIGGGNIQGKNTRSGVYVTPGITEDSSRVTISNSNLNASRCVGDICLNHVKINCYSDKGLVEYNLVNNGSSAASGKLYLNLQLSSGTHTAIIVYENVAAGGREKGYYGYDGFDLRDVTSYSISAYDPVDDQSINDGVHDYGDDE